jgi:prophage regulatory protein
LSDCPASERLLSWPDVRARVGLCRATVYTLRRARRFPEPVRISAKRIAWRESAIIAWIAQRPDAREVAPHWCAA